MPNIDEFFFSEGIKITLIICPFKVVELEDNTNKAFCLVCDEEIHRLRKNNYDYKSHNLLRCLQNLKGDKKDATN